MVCYIIQVAQYYQSVVTVLESNVGAPLVKKHKDWIKSLQMKCSYYTAIAHVRIKLFTNIIFIQMSHSCIKLILWKNNLTLVIWYVYNYSSLYHNNMAAFFSDCFPAIGLTEDSIHW